MRPQTKTLASCGWATAPRLQKRSSRRVTPSGPGIGVHRSVFEGSSVVRSGEGESAGHHELSDPDDPQVRRSLWTDKSPTALTVLSIYAVLE
jgi:hypothetical protein